MLCFALLAHKDEPALLQQIRNIRKYSGDNILIVLYNGGKNPDFGKELCKKENVMYCPYSRPFEKRKTGRCFYDVMRWLEEKKVRYDYLVYIEYDVLFVNHGFERWVREEMKDYDGIVSYIRHETDPQKTSWTPGRTMWKEWSRWKPFFNSDGFYGTFNPMQVYRHSLVKRMLARINKAELEELFKKTDVYALGEILYITLAILCGGKCKPYPQRIKAYFRFNPELRLKEAQHAKEMPETMFVHPVKKSEVRNWICK